jgi:hypothetical protein
MNRASATDATISGGSHNHAIARRATVGGGFRNVVSGTHGTIPGGLDNLVAGDYSFAAGRRAKAVHHGTFVWADSTDADLASTAENQFLVRAHGGARFTGGNDQEAALYAEQAGGGVGIHGEGGQFGVFGRGDSISVLGECAQGDTVCTGVYGRGSTYGVVGVSSSGLALYGQGDARITGDLEVRGTITGTLAPPGADFAEMLPAAGGLEPGDVLVIGADGKLARSTQAHQPTVAGVYSTQPGVLGGAGGSAAGKVPLAVVGVVPVKASAENGAIRPGDLLAASDTPGHAMRAGPNPALGTVIGKALAGLEQGRGIIQMLVVLQ